MLEQGENPKVLQEVLCHSRITRTVGTCSPASPNTRKEGFGRLDRRLEGPCEERLRPYMRENPKGKYGPQRYASQ